MKMVFEPPKKESPKVIVKRSYRNDDSWRNVRLGCNKFETDSNPRKRKTEPDCMNDDGYENDDRNQLLNYGNQTWDGWRGEPGTVGFDEGAT